MQIIDRPHNFYDNAKIDVSKLYDLPGGPLEPQKNPFRFIYRASILPLNWRKYIWLLLAQIHLDLFWFLDIKRYWSKFLGLRPLWGVEDFYFLRSWYRIGFQYTEVSDSSDAQNHVAAWQSPTILYFLLQQVYEESKYRHFEVLKLTKKYLRVKKPRYLEYGSGIGPVTQTFRDFDSQFEMSTFTVTDIKTVAYHYAIKRFGSLPNVKILPLQASNNLQLQGLDEVDCIFCITVFEHLNAPLDTIQKFHKILNSGGLLFFDYIKGDGGGLDTAAGVRERQAVLDFVSKNFEVLQTAGGKIDPNVSLGLTLVRKK